MKILHVLGQTEDVGGILSVVRNLHEATRALGVQHVVYVNRMFRETQSPSLDYRYGRYCLDEHPNHLFLLIRAVRASFELKALLAEESFAVVHGHYRGILLALVRLALEGRRVIFTNHAYARRTRLYRAIARHPRIHTVLLTQNMARHYGLKPEFPRISLVPACCADRHFSAPLVCRRPTPGQGPFRFVGLGSLLRWKNWHLLLDALAQLPTGARRRVEFHHWGAMLDLPESRAYAKDLAGQVQRLGLADGVVFHGNTSDVGAALRTADWFVLPSTNEPCSVALSEAMALGLPALVSASGGNVDLVENGRTGLWFQPDATEDLSQRILSIVRGDARVAEPAAIREAALGRAASAVAARYLELYRAVAGADGSPSPVRK